MLIKKLTQVFSLDLRSLALLRISIAVIGLVDLALRGRDLVAHYSNSGVYPGAMGLWNFPIIIFILSAVFFTSLLVGYKTRLSTLLAFIFLLVIQLRNPFVFQKSDDILRLILLWGFFLPWGEVYSLDASGRQPQEQIKKSIFSVATVAYFSQIMLIYITTALLKSSPIWRTEGSAIFYALASDHYTSAIGYFLLGFPSWMLQILTHSVWWFELLGPLLLIIPIFNPLFRIIGIVAFIGLHIGFGSTMQLQLFPWICSAAMFAFIPGVVWDNMHRFLPFKKQREFTLYYDHTCSFCKKIVMVFKSFLFLPDMECVSAQSNPAMLLEMEEKDSWILSRKDEHFYRFDVFINLLSASPIFWPLEKLAKIKIVKIIGEKLYTAISSRRKRICKVSQHRPITASNKSFSILLQLIAGVFLFIILVWTAGTVTDKIHVPKSLVPVAQFFHLDQRWDMFAPHPFTSSYWYVMPGRLKDGSLVDVFSGASSLSWSKPASISGTYRNSRWQNYLMQFSNNQQNNLLYAPYGQYLCQQWNRSHSEEKQLSHFQIFIMSQQNKFNQPSEAHKRTSLWKHQCN